ncbi:hypothetical protein KUTeg_024395 [Tegillarca granosa]|uniref:Uncharacterized protein n=1 Tax=Tegillarca granosa TaxID=220873 RepID=A0ABQ9DXR7_TEGGR|nr:hypothetical protein KUTeg_024395 [Tegillarca granosa]
MESLIRQFGTMIQQLTVPAMSTSGETLYATEFPKFCSDTSQTSTSVPSTGLKMTMTSSNSTCDAQAQCSFPDELSPGVWVSALKGDLTVSNTTIFSYPTNGILNIFVSSLTLDCMVQNGNKYILKSRETFNAYGGDPPNFFLCLELHFVKEYMFYYYIGTNYDLFAADQLLGHSTDEGLTQACNRQEPYDTGSFVMFVKQGMVESGNVSTQCPDGMLAQFASVNITNNAGQNDYCSETSLDVCTDRTMMNYTYNETCTNVKTYSAGGIYTCLHAITEGTVTFLTVWNNDTTAFQRVGATVYATEAPRFCNDSDQTPYAVGDLNGVNCPDYESTTTVNVTTTVTEPVETSSASLELLALLVLLILIPLIIILVLLIKKFILPKLRKPKPVLPKKKIIDLGRADQNAKKTFRLHSYQTDDTRNLVPIFKPKKPIRVSPVFDSMWEPGKLPFLLPLPKVEPLYHDTLEDYLRARLPRRPSHLSLYSFDSVIFSTDP